MTRPTTSSLSVGEAAAVYGMILSVNLANSALAPARVAVTALRARPIGYDLGVERGLAGKVL
jgi:hypothetical protein